MHRIALSIGLLFIFLIAACGAEEQINDNLNDIIYVDNADHFEDKVLSPHELSLSCYYLQLNVRNAWHNEYGTLDVVGIGSQSPKRNIKNGKFEGVIYSYTYHALVPIRKALWDALSTFHSFDRSQSDISPSVVIVVNDELPGCKGILD